MLIAISTYQKPLEEVDAHRQAHLDFLHQLFAEKKLLMSGRQNPPTGGVIIPVTTSKAEFEAMLADDPFQKMGMAKYNIIEFNPTSFHPALKSLYDE